MIGLGSDKNHDILIQQCQTRLSFITWAQLAFTWEYYCWIQMVLCLLTSSFSSCWYWQYVARVMFQNTELHDWSLVGRCDYLLWAQFIDNRQLILGIKALPMLEKVCAIQSSQQQTLTCHLYLLAGFLTHLLIHRSHKHFAIAPFEYSSKASQFCTLTFGVCISSMSLNAE